jgi:hypothetical protein
LELAQENKKRKNLEVPATSKFKGITDANPFSILQKSSLVSSAKVFGVIIEDDLVNEVTGTSERLAEADPDLPPSIELGFTSVDDWGFVSEDQPIESYSAFSPFLAASTPFTTTNAEAQVGLLEDSDNVWFKICRNRRGNWFCWWHPSRVFFPKRGWPTCHHVPPARKSQFITSSSCTGKIPAKSPQFARFLAP